MVKVFQSNANGKIEFTRAELEKLLNEVYKKGYDSGVSDTKQNYWTWTSPTVNLRSPDINYTTGTPAIDNLRAGTDISAAVKNTPTAAPDSIGVQLCGINDIHTGADLAKCVDDIVNALSSGGPYTPHTPKTNVISNERAETSTPHAKLARELMNL